MPKKKIQPFLLYAIEHRKKYEKIARKRLSNPELVSYANNDWTNESDQIKQVYKDMAKLKNGDMSSSGFVHETSCNRIDCEGPVISDKEVGVQWETVKDNSVRDSLSALNIRLDNLTNPYEIFNWKLSVFHFNEFVSYMDGLSVPAEVGCQAGTISSGLGDTYTNIFNVNPLSDIRMGFGSDVKTISDLEHGIFPYEDLIMAEDVETIILKLKDIVMFDERCINLCRSEDLSKVLGCWFWMKETRPELQLPQPNVIPIEDFMIIVMDYFTAKNLTSQPGFPKVTRSQLTTRLSISTMESDLRCEFHNLADFCDKRSCSKMNATHYWSLMMEFLCYYIPESYKHTTSSPNSSSGDSSYDQESPRSGKQRLLPPTYFVENSTQSHPALDDGPTNNNETSRNETRTKPDYRTHELKHDDNADNEIREPLRTETTGIPRRPQPNSSKPKPITMSRPRGSAGLPQNIPGGSYSRGRGRRTGRTSTGTESLSPISTPTSTPNSTRSMSPLNSPRTPNRFGLSTPLNMTVQDSPTSTPSSSSPTNSPRPQTPNSFVSTTPPNNPATTTIGNKDNAVSFGRGRARRPMTNKINVPGSRV